MLKRVEGNLLIFRENMSKQLNKLEVQKQSISMVETMFAMIKDGTLQDFVDFELLINAYMNKIDEFIKE